MCDISPCWCGFCVDLFLQSPIFFSLFIFLFACSRKLKLSKIVNLLSVFHLYQILLARTPSSPTTLSCELCARGRAQGAVCVCVCECLPVHFFCPSADVERLWGRALWLWLLFLLWKTCPWTIFPPVCIARVMIPRCGVRGGEGAHRPRPPPPEVITCLAASTSILFLLPSCLSLPSPGNGKLCFGQLCLPNSRLNSSFWPSSRLKRVAPPPSAGQKVLGSILSGEEGGPFSRKLEYLSFSLISQTPAGVCVHYLRWGYRWESFSPPGFDQ